MDNILQLASIARPCNSCGGTFTVTLHDIVMERRLQQDWSPARACSSCSVEDTFLLNTLPVEALENIAVEWERVAEVARGKGVDIQLGPTG
jgi:hypothetical protein